MGALSNDSPVRPRRSSKSYPHNYNPLEMVKSTSRRRRPLIYLFGAVAAITLLFHFTSPSAFTSSNGIWPKLPSVDSTAVDPSQKTWLYIRDRNTVGGGHRPRRPSWGALKSLGQKAKFRQGLRDDKNYVISDVIMGWNNQVIETMNLIYLGMLSERIPILSPFSVHPGHIDTKTGPIFSIPVSQIFDLSTLSTIINLPIVETHELKRTPGVADWMAEMVYDGEMSQVSKISGENLVVGDIIEPEKPDYDMIGCYSWAQTAHKPQTPFDSMYISWAKYLPLPPSVLHKENIERLNIHKFSKIISSKNKFQIPSESYDLLKSEKLETPEKLPEHEVTCVDLAFFFMDQPDRFGMVVDEIAAGFGVWSAVGRHMKFQPGLVELANDYLRHIFGLKAGVPIPPYLAIHVRRTDMMSHRPWWAAKTATDWMYEARQLLDQVKEVKGAEVRHVIVTTDEKDHTWLAPFFDAGFKVINHTETATAQRLGSSWFPTLIDAIMLSHGTAFLGMEDSTMSVLAYRRMVDWHAGFAKFAKATVDVPAGWTWSWSP